MTSVTIYTDQPKVNVIGYYTAPKLLYIKNQNINKKIKFCDKKSILIISNGRKIGSNSESSYINKRKDQKKHIQNNLSVWMINPAKNELGTLSKCILKTMNKEIRKKQDLNYCKNTEDVTNWINKI